MQSCAPCALFASSHSHALVSQTHTHTHTHTHRGSYSAVSLTITPANESVLCLCLCVCVCVCHRLPNVSWRIRGVTMTHVWTLRMTIQILGNLHPHPHELHDLVYMQWSSLSRTHERTAADKSQPCCTALPLIENQPLRTVHRSCVLARALVDKSCRPCLLCLSPRITSSRTDVIVVSCMAVVSCM